MEEEMEELYIEGLANHDDPDHALSLVRVAAKRWLGARAGRAIEPRNHTAAFGRNQTGRVS